jgi:dipeptidase D
MAWFDETKPYESALIADLNQIVKIPSVLDPKTSSDRTPFGVDLVRALAKMEEFAARDGFRYGRVDNMVTWIEYGPTDAAETIGILTHIDIVPAGDGWLRDPYKPEILDGLYFGRGAADMKADLMSSYYALKYLKDHDIQLTRKIRLIIGTDEENGWRDIPKYFAVEGEPTMGFSPDGAFPVVNGEKAFLTVQLRFSSQSDGDYELRRFMSGTRHNVVPGEAKARLVVPNPDKIIVDFRDYLKQYPFLSGQTSMRGQELALTMVGVQAHGAYPQDGENAATYLANFLMRYPFEGDAAAFLNFLGMILHDDIGAKNLGLAYHDDVMGDLTMNAGVVRFSQNGQGSIVLNFRYPQGVNATAVKTQVERHLHGLPATVELWPGNMEPHLVPETDPLVGILSMVYAGQTGLYRAPRTSNGGSYARLMKRGVAFGGQFPDVPVSSHQVNESTPVANLTRSMAIFTEALIKLAE